MVSFLSDLLIMLCEDNCRNEASSSNSNFNSFWSEIWKTPVLNKVRNYLWRIAKNIFPSRCNLSKKGIHLDTSCPLCNDCEESIDHMVMHCNVMKMSLFASQIGTHIPRNMHYHAWISQ